MSLRFFTFGFCMVCAIEFPLTVVGGLYIRKITESGVKVIKTTSRKNYACTFCGDIRSAYYQNTHRPLPYKFCLPNRPGSSSDFTEPLSVSFKYDDGVIGFLPLFKHIKDMPYLNIYLVHPTYNS